MGDTPAAGEQGLNNIPRQTTRGLPMVEALLNPQQEALWEEIGDFVKTVPEERSSRSRKTSAHADKNVAEQQWSVQRDCRC